VLCRFRSNTDSESGLVVRNPFSFSLSFSYIYREMRLLRCVTISLTSAVCFTTTKIE
jgi:hypothetical protein